MWSTVVRKTFKRRVIKQKKLPVYVFKSSKKKFSTSPFPNRPGYGLGSWIPPLVVKGMKEEAKYRSGIVVLNQIETDMDSVMRELLLEKNQMENSEDSSQTLELTPELQRTMENNIKKMSHNKTKILNEKFKMYMQLFDVQERLMEQAIKSNSNNPNPNQNRAEESFSTFDVGVQSPVDYDRSKIVHLPRAFDSITVNAHFFTKDIEDQTGNSHNMNVVGAVKKTGQKWFGSTTNQLAAAVSNSMTRTSETHDIESTLLVSAYALHSKVRQFSPLIIDPDLLLSAWNHYQPQYKIILDKISESDLTENDDRLNEPTIDLFAECFLGSAMVGLVHFIQTESTVSMQSTSKQSLQAMQSVRSSSFLSGITGDTGLAIEMAQKAASALSSSGFDVRFDLVCLGYLPTIKSNTVQLAIKEFKDFDPAKFSVDNTQENYADLDALSNHLLNKSKDQATKQSNMGSVIRSTLQSLSESQEKNLFCFGLSNIYECI